MLLKLVVVRGNDATVVRGNEALKDITKNGLKNLRVSRQRIYIVVKPHSTRCRDKTEF